MQNRNSCNRNNSQFIRNALIEEINRGNRADFVTISYGVPGDFNLTIIELMVLVVDQTTVIRDRCGRNLSIRDLRVGMRVDARISQRMTFSIPPQAQAYEIIVNC